MHRISKQVLLFIVFFSFASFLRLSAQSAERIERIEPPFWWSGIQYDTLQLMIYGKDISGYEVKSESDALKVLKSQMATNPNYLFVDLLIGADAVPGFYAFTFKNESGKNLTYNYELKSRNNQPDKWKGFDSSDAIYLLMPDRFADADTTNDTVAGMLEKADRSSPHGRHGGDIEGIIDHLSYISGLGFTALWITPLLENNMPEYSYHGYGITDFYRIDSRFGSNTDYVQLVDSAHSQGLKIIMDMVLNHCGTNHWFVCDLPSADWLNQWETPTYSNFRAEVMTDPHASEYDKNRLEKGWFAPLLADLNLGNPILLKYLIQNTIWWIEYAGIDGIRMDTYPYPKKESMVEWTTTVRKLYPRLTIVGETWLQKTAHTAYWQSGTCNYDGYDSHIPVVTDFPLYYAIGQSMNESEGWTEGLRRLYYVLSEDFLYADPKRLLIFADNHDLNRYYSAVDNDLNKFMMGLAFLLTTRGIPQVYYGTEILMTGDKSQDDGFIRQDFPGGWPGDEVNAFTGEGLSPQQVEASIFIGKLLKWRQTSNAIQNGKLVQFIPENDVYVYFRNSASQSVMIILNKNPEEIVLNTERFSEGLTGYKAARNILTGAVLNDIENIHLPAFSPIILELIKKPIAYEK
jgi:glycosidase